MTRLASDRPDSLSVPEMLRIMDVATSLRLDREQVEEQLDVDLLKDRLKERMLAASRVTGEPVTPEEVDAAIRQYYDNLHTFQEPKLGLAVALAHVWVRRGEILGTLGMLLLAGTLAWWLFLSPDARLSTGGRNRRQVAQLSGEIAREAQVVRSIARDPGATASLAELLGEADAFRQKGDPKGLAYVRRAMARMEARLLEEYAVKVVSGAKQQSAFDRTYAHPDGKRSPAYYLIVQAQTPDGTTLTRQIHDSEDNTVKDVTTWAERVPEAVYRRLARDKREDGMLDETAFAEKRKGSIDEEVTMKGADGRSLDRLGQITKW